MKNSTLLYAGLLLSVLALFPYALLSQSDLQKHADSRSGNAMELSASDHSRGINTDSTLLHYDDVENFDSWGFLISGEIYDVMSKWDPEDLVDYEGWAVKSVKFIVVSDMPVLQVKIWQGPEATEIYSQDVPTYNVNTWTEVELDSAVVFDNTTELYVGYHVDMTEWELGGFVTATDDGPPVDGYGNLVRWDGSWLSDYNNHNLRFLIVESLTANFMADKTTVCDSNVVAFTNLSPSADTYQWIFQGGTPFISTLENPTVTYNIPGTYDVTLTVTSGGHSATEYKQDYIQVLEIPGQIEGEDLVCQWTEDVYSVPENPWSTYTWEVTNGTIESGQGTSEVTVSWMAAGAGSLSVTESTSYGCQGTGQLEVTVDECTGIDEKGSQTGLRISPNPVYGNKMTIMKENSEIIPVYIQDLNGRIILQDQLLTAQTTLDIGKLSKGMYILKAIFADRIESVKIIRY